MLTSQLYSISPLVRSVKLKALKASIDKFFHDSGLGCWSRRQDKRLVQTNRSVTLQLMEAWKDLTLKWLYYCINISQLTGSVSAFSNAWFNGYPFFYNHGGIPTLHVVYYFRTFNRQPNRWILIGLSQTSMPQLMRMTSRQISKQYSELSCLLLMQIIYLLDLHS